MPPAEDDAEVCGIPCEQHLLSASISYWDLYYCWENLETCIHIAHSWHSTAHVVVHVGVVHVDASLIESVRLERVFVDLDKLGEKIERRL